MVIDQIRWSWRRTRNRTSIHEPEESNQHWKENYFWHNIYDGLSASPALMILTCGLSSSAELCWLLPLSYRECRARWHLDIRDKWYGDDEKLTTTRTSYFNFNEPVGEDRWLSHLARMTARHAVKHESLASTLVFHFIHRARTDLPDAEEVPDYTKQCVWIRTCWGCISTLWKSTSTFTEVRQQYINQLNN